MDENLLEQEIENIRREIVSKFFIDYIGLFIVISAFIFILPLTVCQCFAFLLKSIWGIIFLFVISVFISLYIHISYSQEKIKSKIKNLFLNTGLVYNNIRITKSKNTNNILQNLVEFDLNHNYVSIGNIYNLTAENYSEVIQVGVVYLSTINYSSHRRYYRDSNMRNTKGVSITITSRYKDEGFKYVILESFREELIYKKSSNIQTAIIFLVPENLFDYEKAQKEGIKCKKVENMYLLLIDNDSVKQIYELIKNNKEYEINIDILKKIDKEKILQIMEASIQEPREIINMIKRKGVIKCF